MSLNDKLFRMKKIIQHCMNYFIRLLFLLPVFSLAVPKPSGPDDNLFPLIVTKPTLPDNNSNAHRTALNRDGDATPVTSTPAPVTTTEDGGLLPTDPDVPVIPVPGLPTSPGGVLPIFPSNPPVTTLPGLGSSNISGLFNFGGNGQMTAAQVPNEFYCPLFENNPYDAIFRALDIMNQSIRASTECQQVQSQYSDFYSDSEKIRNLIVQIQQYTQNPDYISGVNTYEIERVITDAISGINSIATNISNSSLINKNCGDGSSSIGKALLSVNDILNNLAPIGLVIAATNPQISVAVKLALLGTVYGTTAIKGFQQFITANSLDMNNSEVRRAILQNTCQFVKIRQKIDFLQLGEEGRLGEIKESLFKNIEAYRIRYNNPSTELLPLMQYKYQTEKVLADLEARIVEDKYNINRYNAKIKSVGDDPERICYIGASLVRNSKDGETFPISTIRVMESAVEATKLGGQSGQVDTLVQADQEELYESFRKSRDRLSVYTAKALNATPEDAANIYKLCADETKSWIKRIYDAIVFSDKLINKEAAEIETALSQNDEFKNWNAQYKKLKSEKSSLGRVISVLKEMSRPDAVYIRSELDQRSQELRAALFRKDKFFSDAPVTSWLKNNLKMHEVSLARFREYIKLLKTGSVEISKNNFDLINKGMPWFQQHNDMRSGITSVEEIQNINQRSVPVGTREHEVACQQLRDAYLKYKASRDYLGAAQFMCDMIDPFLNDTSNDVISICRGGKTFNSKYKSTITVLFEKMNLRPSNSTPSDDGYGVIVSKKRLEIKCPSPSVDVID